MAIQDDWDLDYSAKTITQSGASSGSRYTVQEFYSWLMDLFDDAGQMDDPVPVKANTPREFEFINGWAMAADSDYGYLKSGAIVDKTNNDIWACFYSLGSIVSDTQVYVEQNGSLVASAPGYDPAVDPQIDILIKVSAAGTPIDGMKITAYARNIGDTYDNYEATATATGGYNPIPLATEPDANDDESGATVTGCDITFGTVSKDIGDGDGAVNYDAVVDGGGNSVADVYKWLKYITRRENTTAIDGVAEATEGRFYQSVNPSTYTVVKKAPFGSFAGGTFFGARGIWLENISDPNNRELIDAAGASHTPPVSITVSITGLSVGDRALIAKDDGFGAIDKSQYTIFAVTSNTIQATVSLSSDTPASGVVRVGDTRYTYSGVSSDTLTGVSPDPTGETGSFYVPLVDDEAAGSSLASGSMIYSADFDIVARVRAYGILPFENTGTVTNAGLTVSAIRTPDNIVS